MANETLTEVFGDIADAIRGKGVIGQMKPTEMATKIADIPSGGSGDPRYEVNDQGRITKLNFDVTWFGDLKEVATANDLIYAYYQSNVTSANFPELTSVSGNLAMNNCFKGCTNLSSVSFPKLASVASGGMSTCFRECTSLSSVSFPELSSIGG